MLLVEICVGNATFTVLGTLTWDPIVSLKLNDQYVTLLLLFRRLIIIRSWADDLILYYRRPLPVKSWGLGAWWYVLQILPFLAGFINVRNSLILDRIRINYHIIFISV